VSKVFKINTKNKTMEIDGQSNVISMADYKDKKSGKREQKLVETVDSLYDKLQDLDVLALDIYNSDPMFFDRPKADEYLENLVFFSEHVRQVVEELYRHRNRNRKV